VNEAVNEIAAKAGIDFDPNITRSFMSLISEIQVRDPDIDKLLGVSESNSTFTQARARISAFLAELPLGI
jgi:HD-GYP domain-containing protein (c-di-GMP phosphodiesterase class II)